MHMISVYILATGFNDSPADMMPDIEKIEASVRFFNESGLNSIFVVVGYNSSKIINKINPSNLPCKILIHKKFETGLNSAIRFSLRYLPEDSKMAIFLQLYPNTTIIDDLSEFYNSCLKKSKRKGIISAGSNIKPEFPIMLKKKYLDELIAGKPSKDIFTLVENNTQTAVFYNEGPAPEKKREVEEELLLPLDIDDEILSLKEEVVENNILVEEFLPNEEAIKEEDDEDSELYQIEKELIMEEIFDEQKI